MREASGGRDAVFDEQWRRVSDGYLSPKAAGLVDEEDSLAHAAFPTEYLQKVRPNDSLERKREGWGG